MKLAIVVDTFPRWSERFIAREVAELRRRGVDLTVFCLNAGRLAAENDPDWTGLLEERVVLPSCLAPRSLRMHSADPEMQGRLDAVKAELGLPFLFKISCVAALRDLLRDSFQHVHAHFANLPSTLAWLSATAEKIPFSMSVHARDLFVEPQLLGQKLADATRVFTCHDRGYKHLAKTVAHAGKVVLMRHGLPLEHFPFTQHSAPKKGEAVRLLAAGRFVPKKGFDELLEAVAAPGLAGKGFELTHLGDGPGRKKLASQIKRRKLEKQILIQPPAGGAELQELFNRADAFLAPYQETPEGDSDGVPNVVLEAFALGLPVIGTDAGGVKEVLTPETGSVVPAGNAEALATAVGDYLNDSAAALARTPAARALVEREYDIRRNILPLLELVGIAP